MFRSELSNPPMISGIHHITAIASNPQKNINFYVGVLGLRFIKRTVNFDDPGTYHFYYADEIGTPGTILTFFPWPEAKPGVKGTGLVSAIGFRAPLGSLAFWESRLREAGTLFVCKGTRFSESFIQFEDPDGLLLEIIESLDCESRPFWKDGAISDQFALRGFHSATLSVRSSIHTENLLEDKFGMIKTLSDDLGAGRVRFTSASGDIIDLVTDSNLPFGESGAGTVHHIAMRASNDLEQHLWRDKLNSSGFAVTEVKERNYFRSIYFRERAGILFEIATDGPGFNIDEPLSALGSGLKLPEQYEKYRQVLYRKLPGLHLPSVRNPGLELHTHLFETANNEINEKTILLLHGTGGDEKSMLSLGRELSKEANLISPRGNVLEGMQNRFFRRLQEGVFDVEDLKFRSAELANWIGSAEREYGFDLSKTTAIGFSNGANIAAAILLLGLAKFKNAVLICAMPPFSPEILADLSDHNVLIIAGNKDPLVSYSQSSELAASLKKAGARVTSQFFECGHEITEQSIECIKTWLSNE